MNKTFLLLFAILAAPSSGVAQDLSSDLVVERDGMYVYEEYGIARVQLPGNDLVKFQVKLSSEAPADGTISRDNFVAITVTTDILVLLAGFGQGYDATVSEFLDAYDYTELDAPIGTPDYEVNLRMTGEGMQLEFVNTATGDVSRTVWTWEEVYAN